MLLRLRCVASAVQYRLHAACDRFYISMFESTNKCVNSVKKTISAALGRANHQLEALCEADVAVVHYLTVISRVQLANPSLVINSLQLLWEQMIPSQVFIPYYTTLQYNNSCSELVFKCF